MRRNSTSLLLLHTYTLTNVSVVDKPQGMSSRGGEYVGVLSLRDGKDVKVDVQREIFISWPEITREMATRINLMWTKGQEERPLVSLK